MEVRVARQAGHEGADEEEDPDAAVQHLPEIPPGNQEDPEEEGVDHQVEDGAGEGCAASIQAELNEDDEEAEGE